MLTESCDYYTSRNPELIVWRRQFTNAVISWCFRVTKKLWPSVSSRKNFAETFTRFVYWFVTSR